MWDLSYRTSLLVAQVLPVEDAISFFLRPPTSAPREPSNRPLQVGDNALTCFFIIRLILFKIDLTGRIGGLEFHREHATVLPRRVGFKRVFIMVREPLVLGHEEEVDDDRRAREPGDACV